MSLCVLKGPQICSIINSFRIMSCAIGTPISIKFGLACKYLRRFILTCTKSRKLTKNSFYFILRRLNICKLLEY